MKINAFVDAKKKTIVFESNGGKAKVSFGEWDEWGSVTIDGVLMDYHILFDEELTVSVYTLKHSDGRPVTKKCCDMNDQMEIDTESNIDITLTNETITLEDEEYTFVERKRLRK